MMLLEVPGHLRSTFRLSALRADNLLTNGKLYMLIPLNVVCFVWRACLDRIPTAVALAKRKVNVPNTACVSCAIGLDEANHSLLKCPFTYDALSWICKWCDIPLQQFDTISDLVGFAAQWGQCTKKRKIFMAIIYGFLWCGWKARNAKVFNKMRINSATLADNVMTLGFNWAKYRGKFGDCNWGVWCCNPFNIL